MMGIGTATAYIDNVVGCKLIKKKGTVGIGLSGGVDSAVSAYLLKQQGYEVVGVYMSNWKETDENGCCTGEKDWEDVRNICNKWDIPYYSVDLSSEYYEDVFRLFIEEYRKGRTPNPDVLCNREIKFGYFANKIKGMGLDYLATGHYAKVVHQDGRHYLYRSKDENKDQTYFLNQVSEIQLSNVIFPLEDIEKQEVRKIATDLGLNVATKKDSTGICFIGERNFRNFLSNYIPMKKGDIVTTEGEKVGEHRGIFFYTVGQRKGLGLGGKKDGNGDRWFVVAKDVANNKIIVSQSECDLLYTDTLKCNEFNYINKDIYIGDVDVRIKHRQPLQKAILEEKDGSVVIKFNEKQRAIVPGQYAVAYVGKKCIGGGVIDDTYNR